MPHIKEINYNNFLLNCIAEKKNNTTEEKKERTRHALHTQIVYKKKKRDDYETAMKEAIEELCLLYASDVLAFVHPFCMKKKKN